MENPLIAAETVRKASLSNLHTHEATGSSPVVSTKKFLILQEMSCSQDEMKKAVECGYWHCYRYDPRLAEQGKNPFQLDSPEPDTSKLMDFLMGENRFASLKNNFPEKADALYQKEISDVKARYNKYRKMADEA